MNIRLYKAHEFLNKHIYDRVLVKFHSGDRQIVMCKCGRVAYQISGVLREILIAWRYLDQSSWDEEKWADKETAKLISAFEVMKRRLG